MPKSVDVDSLTNNVYWTKHVARLNKTAAWICRWEVSRNWVLNAPLILPLPLQNGSCSLLGWVAKSDFGYLANLKVFLLCSGTSQLVSSRHSLGIKLFFNT